MSELPTELELKALRLALRGEVSWLANLRGQVEFLRVKDRKLFSTGFFTRFTRLDNETSIAMISDEKMTDGYPPSINAEMTESPGELVTFVVWVGEDGYISELDVSSLSGLELPGSDIGDYRRFQDDLGCVISDE